MEKISNNQTIGLLIVSILVAALIVRIIYVIFDGVRVFVEEIFDDDNVLPFDRSSYYILNAILVTCICLFCLILLYEGYVIGYINKISETESIKISDTDTRNINFAVITPMTIDMGHQAHEISGHI